MNVDIMPTFDMSDLQNPFLPTINDASASDPSGSTMLPLDGFSLTPASDLRSQVDAAVKATYSDVGAAATPQTSGWMSAVNNISQIAARSVGNLLLPTIQHATVPKPLTANTSSLATLTKSPTTLIVVGLVLALGASIFIAKR